MSLEHTVEIIVQAFIEMVDEQPNIFSALNAGRK